MIDESRNHAENSVHKFHEQQIIRPVDHSGWSILVLQSKDQTAWGAIGC
jgi:hypothetical protein